MLVWECGCVRIVRVCRYVCECVCVHERVSVCHRSLLLLLILAFQCVKLFKPTLNTCCVSGSVPGTGDMVTKRAVQGSVCGAHTKQTDARLLRAKQQGGQRVP